MPTNDQAVGPNYLAYEAEQAQALEEELAVKFLQILAQPDVVIPAADIPEDGQFTDEQRAVLQDVLKAEMPSPQEIQQQIEIMAHNAEITRKRVEKQAAKRARREALGRRHRRR